MFITRTVSKLTFMCTGFGFAALAASASFAGENKIYLLQNSGPNAVTGNTIMIDQGAASGSLVVGSLDVGPLESRLPASQIGDGNRAEITIADTGGTVVFNQGSTDSFQPANNAATVNLNGFLGQAFLSQQGAENVGALSAIGSNVFASLEQIGNRNEGSVSVTGAGARGVLRQEGDDNNLGLTVTGAGTTATYTQVGNNLTAPSGFAQVISNGGTVSITQYGR